MPGNRAEREESETAAQRKREAGAQARYQKAMDACGPDPLGMEDWKPPPDYPLPELPRCAVCLRETLCVDPADRRKPVCAGCIPDAPATGERRFADLRQKLASTGESPS